MKLPSKHRIGRALFNVTFVVLLSGIVVMFAIAGAMCGCGAWTETIAAMIVIPILTRVCSDMADYAMSLIWIKPEPKRGSMSLSAMSDQRCLVRARQHLTRRRRFPERSTLEALYRASALEPVMRRMGIGPRGDGMKFALRRNQRRKSLQGQRLVAMLRALVARHDGQTARDVDGTHRALGSVLVLAAGAAGPERFKANVAGGQRGCRVRRRR